MKAMTNQTMERSAPAAIGARSDGLWGFLILTYGMTFLTWGLMALAQFSVASATNTEGETSVIAMLAYLFGGFTPSIAGFIMAYRMDGRVGIRQLWKRFTQFKLGSNWYLVTIAVPLVNLVIVSLVHKMQGGNFYSPDLSKFAVTMIPIVISVFLFGPVSEEFGWRGFALDRVQARWGMIKGNLALSLIWAFWHLPLFFIPGSGQQLTGNPAMMFPIFAADVLGMTFLITWVYNNTNRSVWGATFFHFTMNFGTVILLTFSDASDAFAYKNNAVNYILMVLVMVLLTKLSKMKES